MIEDLSRPMYRKDIFYSGSVYNISNKHKEQPKDTEDTGPSTTSIVSEVDCCSYVYVASFKKTS
jgi:hypothetical protein